MMLELLVPSVITMSVTGHVKQQTSEELLSGRRVVVEYKNATQSMDMNQFIVMVLAKRLSMSSEVEVLKAESIMIRTDICRMMADNMSIDSTSLGMEYLTISQMKNLWQNDYEENYNLINDCVLSTGNLCIFSGEQPIDARYTEVSSGTTLSGAELLGEGYEYLASVACSEDIKSTKYLSVETFSNKEFVKKMTAAYSQIGLKESDVFGNIQIAARTDSGYIIKIQVGNVVMTGAEFAKILELNSACMTIENLDGSIKITTKGVGEGFGVSIYTADVLAGQGKSYEEILKNFYSGVQIRSL
jgi:stage II sporulation protein D